MSEERITVGHLDRIDAVTGWDVIEGEWRPVRHQLGIKSFGVNAWVADAGQRIIEEHDELPEPGHEELYVVLRGHARFAMDGEAMEAPAGTLIAIHDPSVVRSAVAVEDGTAILAVGTPIGEKFEVADYEKRMLGPST